LRRYASKLALFTHCILPPPSPRVVLLHGPPGTGKTSLSRSLAAEMGLGFLEVSHSALLSKYIGESEKYLDGLFAALRDAGGGGVLFFDEVDSLLGRPNSSVLKQMLISLNHFLDTTPVFKQVVVR
jgi:SpoVK/Ycf46/Vps4 family AAA+-type ATPase